MTSERLQTLIHKLDSGVWAKWIRRGLIAVAVLYVVQLWLFRDGGFRGLAHEKAMDQAQVAREIARGHGFATKFIRPAAVWQLEASKGAIPDGVFPDTANAPLNPLLGAAILFVSRPWWQMGSENIVATCDRLLAGAQLCCFLLSVIVSYFIAKRLFDTHLAMIGVGLLLMCQKFWDFALAGLPQMLMLLLFSGATFVVIRLLEVRAAGQSTLRWSAALGGLFGLLALTHALTLFMFVGALIFAALFLRPRGRDAGVMLLACALCVVPWALRNYAVCGNPLGIAGYMIFTDLVGSEGMIMRTASLEGWRVSPSALLDKVRIQTVRQLAELFAHLGCVLVAPIFFVALLHPFRKSETALLRWWVLAMWLGAVLGMSVSGFETLDAQARPVAVRANDLHVLFIPLLTFYGLAFVLVLWQRLAIQLPFARAAFVSLLCVVSGLPFLSQVLELQRGRGLAVHWPPYAPPAIAMLHGWTKDSEIIMSDMPWAVAWYADRKSFWLPMALADYTSMSDYSRLHAPIVGLFLTPVSGNQPFMRELVNGDYKGWGRIITRQFDPNDFPLHAVTALPIDGQCIFFADRVRWPVEADASAAGVE